MTKKHDTAFPFCYSENDTVYKGLSKREYFAAMALQGKLSNQVTYDLRGLVDAAIDAVNTADLLIKELNKRMEE